MLRASRFPVTRRRALPGAAVILLGAALAAVPAHADIAVGPWVFDDRAFADRAVQLEQGDLSLYCDAADLDDALTGYSPDTQLVNCGAMENANDFLLEFLDLRAVNLPGPDIVFFEARFSVDGFEIAVRPAGGDLTPLLPYRHYEFLDSGLAPDCPYNPHIYGVEIELDDYGLPPGTIVDAIRFRALPHDVGTGSIEGDAVMAGVLHPACAGVDPPHEPSSRHSLLPLEVEEDSGARLTVERIADATAYNIYAGRIGTWYDATPAGGTVCTLTDWRDNGDGTITLDYRIPPGSWISVSATHACGESGVGTASCGTERFSVGQWERCPPGP